MAFSTHGNSTGGYAVGPVTNAFVGVDLAAAQAARDAYFAANPAKLAAYDSNPFYLIRLSFGVTTNSEYRSGGVWIDYTPFLQGLPGEVASLVAVAVNEIPYKKLDGTFAGSSMRVLDDGSILAPPDFGVESGSVSFGDVLTLSEAAGFLAITNHLNGKNYTLLDYATPRNAASSNPGQFRLVGPEVIFNAQPSVAAVLTDNPLFIQYTVQNTGRNNALTFRTESAMNNVRIKITLVSNGVAAKYIPSKTVWEKETGGLTWGVGDNTFDFEDTPIIFNSGDIISFEFKADSVSMRGSVAGVPYIASTQQQGTFQDAVMDYDYTPTDVRDKLAGLTGTNRLGITSIKDSVITVAGRTGAVVLSASDVSGLASVATTGAYSSLSGLPFIPTKTSDLTNDAAFITSAQAPLQTVAGRAGDVVVTKTDVGLSNADNTSDVNKPTSTAQQASIDLKMTQHNANSDPHPQYTTTAEASAAAPVQTVNGLTGNPVLTTGNITEVGNLYFTDTRVQTYITGAGYTVKSLANTGTGAGVFKSTTSGVSSIKGITAGRGMTVTSNTDDVQVSSTAFPLVYTSGGAVASPKVWYGTVTSDASGLFTVDLSSAGFTAPPIVYATAQLSTATVQDRAWATLSGAPTSTTATGYTLRGISLSGNGATVRTSPTTVVMIMAIGI
jgi:hypothetical protein